MRLGCHRILIRNCKCRLSSRRASLLLPIIYENSRGIVCVCKSSEYSLRNSFHNCLQKFRCLAFGEYFTVNFGSERMKHSPQGTTTAMQLYFSGESLRNTARSLRLLGVQVSYRTVLNWINKYTFLMERYLDKITPNVSDT